MTTVLALDAGSSSVRLDLVEIVGDGTKSLAHQRVSPPDAKVDIL